jgi:hypothetical protein
MPRHRKTGQRGSAIIEAALCISLVWVPLTLGTYEVGFNLIRAVQVTQICRDAGHMYSQGKDFSQPIYQNLLASLMPSSFTLTPNGNTVVYLELLTYMDPITCGGCANQNLIVFTQAIPVGNTAVRPTSNFGNPQSCPNTAGSIASAVYENNPCARATGFSIPLATGQVAWMSEMYVQSSDYSVWKSMGTSGVYARSIF